MEVMRAALIQWAHQVSKHLGLSKLSQHLCMLGLSLFATPFGALAQGADTTKPTTPTAFIATVVSGSQVNLDWAASTDNVGVTGYRIERCTGASCTTWAEVATKATPGYSDTSLVTATTYRYRVRAIDGAGNLSNYSAIRSAKTLDEQAPTTPVNLVATVNSAVKITLGWAAATDNVKVTGYRLERCMGADCSDFVQIATTTTGLTYGNTGLAPLATYQYRVRAVDAAGNFSGYSSVVPATTLADTTKPTTPTALTATATSSAQIDLSWTGSTDAVGVVGYRIYRCIGTTCTNYVQIATTTITAYNDTGLTMATDYRYRVRAIDAAGNLSNYSTAALGTTQAFSDTEVPSVPAGLTATAISGTQINLSWSPSTDNVGVMGYLLERCDGASCSGFSQIANITGTDFSDTALIASTSYSYRIRAVDTASNTSSYSSIASMVTQAGPDTQAPTAPNGLAAAALSGSQISLSWGISTDNVGVTAYLLERCQGAGCLSFSQIASLAGNSYTDSGLVAATSYTYRVRATDAAGNFSNHSGSASATTHYTGPIIFTYTYDALGRITHVAGSDGSNIDYQYDANGNVMVIQRQ